MTIRNHSLETRRANCWAEGVQHRERLLREYMVANGLRERTFLKDVIDDLIREVQGARLRSEVLPLDRVAQTEVVGGRVEVSINSRIAEIPGVKDAAGVAYVAKWHESMHVAQASGSDADELQSPLPGLEVEIPRLIYCRGIKALQPGSAAREFVAENAALAAAIAGPDLARSSAFLRFESLAAAGGDLGPFGWRLLYEAAEDIGANISALTRYLQQRGVVRIEEEGGRRRLIAAPQLFGRLDWR